MIPKIRQMEGIINTKKAMTLTASTDNLWYSSDGGDTLGVAV